MKITLNNLTNPNNLLVFNEVPNILKVSEDIQGTYATFKFSFNSGLQSQTTDNNQWYVSFLGDTVTNMLSPMDAVNKYFYIASDNLSTAASFADALRNCSTISAQFTIYLEGEQVTLVSKTIGQVLKSFTTFIDTNIPSAYLNASGTDGTSNTDLLDSRISVEVLKSNTDSYQYFVTKLDKNFYGNEVAFDISPVLSTFSEYGEIKPFKLKVSALKDNGTFTRLGEITGSTAIGYFANQSERYLYKSNQIILLNKMREGKPIKYYTYGKDIEFSVITEDGSWSVLGVFKNSFGDNIRQQAFGGYSEASGMADCKVYIPDDIYDQVSKVELTYGGGSISDTVTFEVIKPLKLAEGYQRVYWRGCYGGIEYFDFTGPRSETDSVDIETYEKNIYDFYDTEDYEQKMIYSNEYKKTVTLTSHIIEKEGMYLFNDLIRSKRMWTVVNGKTYYIIPQAIEMNEVEGYNDLFEVKLKYTYSYL